MADFSKDDVERIRRSGLFDADWYLRQYPDVKALGMDPAEHYLWLGAKLGRHPGPKFDGAAYLSLNEDVAEQGLNPLLHYVECGRDEGRITAKINGQAELHSSTFGKMRRYAFASAEHLKSIAARHASTNAGQREIAIFSAISGDYDSLCYHEHLLDTADYHIFADGSPRRRYVFDIKPLPYLDEDPVRSARFVKTHPHMLLAGYRIAVWVDGNILIRDDISEMIARFEQSGAAVAGIPHPLRRSVYEEAQECIKRGKDDNAAIDAQTARYRAEGFDCNDLIETNLMMFRLDHPQLASFLGHWWSEIDRGSRRDQISVNYALRKAGLRWHALTQRPESVRNHSSLALFHHGSNRSPHDDLFEEAAAPRRTYADVAAERTQAQAHRAVDVVVCVHNALDVVRPCLESVAQHRNAAKHRIVIVDDGSGAETASWLGAFAGNHRNVRLIRHEKAGGYTKAANAGLRTMTGDKTADMAILLNSDTLVADRWIEKLLDAAFSNPGVGIVGPLSSAASHQSIPDHKSSATQTAINDLPQGYSVADMDRWCERNAPADFIPRVPLVHGFCFAVTRAAAEAIGLFDEKNFPNGYGEENDYCFRAVDAGFSLAIATHTYVYHKKSQSYQDERRVALVKAGNEKIRDLHSKDRVARAVRAMQGNGELARMRQAANALFEHAQSQRI